MMYRLSALALLGAQAVYAAPAVKAARANGMAVSENTVTMKPIALKAGSSRALLSAATGSEALGLVEDDAGYAVETTLSGKTYDLIFDTGSSDLWVFKEGCQCVNEKGAAEPAKDCAFGPEYDGTYSGGTIADKNLYIVYGDEEFVEGSLGYDSVTIAGVNVPKQEMSLVEKSFFEGDGVVSGIVGFAFDVLDSQYPGDPPKTDPPATVENYSNFFHSAKTAGTVDGLFTVILERPNSGSSSVTLGGVPANVSTLDYTSTPLEIKDLTNIPGESTHYSYYTITPAGISIAGASTKTTFSGIVDTGTTLLYLPGQYASDVNAAFDPPSVYDSNKGVYLNDCTATPPKFGLDIGGTTFYISDHELLLQGKLGSVGNGLCVTGVQPAGSGADFAILGDVFLKNVVAVFDQSTKEMKFAAHETY